MVIPFFGQMMNRQSTQPADAALMDDVSDRTVVFRPEPVSRARAHGGDAGRPDRIRSHPSGSSEGSVDDGGPSRSSNGVTSNNAQRVSRKSEWKGARDPKTDRTYYYNVITRETQWHKPLELASSAEREATEAHERKQRDFFASMETNILRNMASGNMPGISISARSLTQEEETDLLGFAPPPTKPSMSRPGRIKVRTISGMDDSVLAELTKGMEKTFSPTSTVRVDTVTVSPIDIKSDAFEEWNKETMLKEKYSSCRFSKAEEDRAVETVKKAADAMKADNKGTLVKPTLTKRNTCGTLYVKSTMSDPDKDAVMKCVCAVYRAHILQSIREASAGFSPIRFDEYEVFDDDQTKPLNACPTLPSEPKAPPSLDKITRFYRSIFLKSQMEFDCIIMSLIYVERLIKMTNGGVRPHAKNWKSILFSSMIMASKVWDDLSMMNNDFSQCGPRNARFSLQRINQLELAMLHCLRYKVKVLASEYAKYYFLLRSMSIRSGLAGEYLDSLAPLDVEGAKLLEQGSHNFQETANRTHFDRPVNRRTKSFTQVTGNIQESDLSAPRIPTATLEQVVNM